MKIKKINLNVVLKYLALGFVCLVLAQAKISGISPFLFAFYFACLYVCLDAKLLAVFTLAGGISTGLILENLLINVTAVAVGLIMVYAHKFAKRRIHLITIFISFVLGCVTYAYYNFNEIGSLLAYIVLGLVCLFVYITVLQVMLLRKNCFKLTLDESICFLFAIATLGLAMEPIDLYSFSISRLFVALALLICVAVGSPILTYSVTISFSLGCALSVVSLVPIAEFVLLAILASVFTMPNKFKIIFMIIIGDVFIQYFFVSQSIEILYAVMPVVVATAVFSFFPKKFLNHLTDLVYIKKSEITSRNVINTTRKNIKKRMLDLSAVFREMQQIHINMIKKDLTKEELIAMLTREILSSNCKDCLDKNKCTRSLGTDNKSNIELMVEIAINKGKISILDVPNGVANRCSKVNYLIGFINRILDEYKQYKTMMADVNNVKILMADQMGAVSRLLVDIGDEIDTNVRFDIARENRIISRLLSLNIQCREVLLYAEKNEDISAVLVVKSENSYNDMIEKVLTETLKVPMQISKITPLEEGDFNSVHLKKKSRYDCVFGLASCNKAGNVESGDCHSIIRLGGNKFLLALCDGMGAGLQAHKMSAMTLGLIENFYKVGFDNDVVLESVNKLLAINNQENYSTLDVCLIDLDKEVADFIKVGAPFGLIKRENKIEVVEGGALPIGVLESISPSIMKTTISTKDIIVMVTDGISDAFGGKEDMIEYVSALATNNPQSIAEAILSEAVRLNDMSSKDDMTVLVARTFLKS